MERNGDTPTVSTTATATRNGAVEALQRRILRELGHRGPLPLAALHISWPLTLHHVRAIVGGLVEDGLLERVAGAASGPAAAYRLTDHGRMLLAPETDGG